MSNPLIHSIASLAYLQDQRTRAELASGIIASEPDYVSALVTRIRDEARHVGFLAYLHSRVLTPSVERAFGCDALIVLKLARFLKLIFFEAKWPRVTGPNYQWDFASPSGLSHFSTQLERQKSLTATAAVFEMFLVETPPGAPLKGFDLYGSACAWHEAAHFYDTQRRHARTALWTQSDVKNALALFRGRQNLQQIILAVCGCSQGPKHHPKPDFKIAFALEGTTFELVIPKGPQSEVQSAATFSDIPISHVLVLEHKESSQDSSNELPLTSKPR